jgi:sensor histidine kinase YesM
LQRELHQLQAQKSEAESAYLSANWRLHLLANTLPMFSFPTF